MGSRPSRSKSVILALSCCVSSVFLTEDCFVVASGEGDAAKRPSNGFWLLAEC